MRAVTRRAENDSDSPSADLEVGRRWPCRDPQRLDSERNVARPGRRWRDRRRSTPAHPGHDVAVVESHPQLAAHRDVAAHALHHPQQQCSSDRASLRRLRARPRWRSRTPSRAPACRRGSARRTCPRRRRGAIFQRPCSSSPSKAGEHAAESNRGRQSQSIEPSRPTSAARVGVADERVVLDVEWHERLLGRTEMPGGPRGGDARGQDPTLRGDPI